MVDSGSQIRSGYVNFASVYREMVDAELARPAQGEMRASWSPRGEPHPREVTLTNRTSTTLRGRPEQGDGARHRLRGYQGGFDAPLCARGGAADIGSLEPGRRRAMSWRPRTWTSHDWDKLHVVALADYRPEGTRRAYDVDSGDPGGARRVGVCLAWRGGRKTRRWQGGEWKTGRQVGMKHGRTGQDGEPVEGVFSILHITYQNEETGYAVVHIGPGRRPCGRRHGGRGHPG